MLIRLLLPIVLLLGANAVAASHDHDHGDHGQAVEACLICAYGIDDDLAPAPKRASAPVPWPELGDTLPSAHDIGVRSRHRVAYSSRGPPAAF